MFITGCRSYKLDSVSKHEKSKGHEKSAAIAKAKSELTVNSDAYKILKTLNSENFERPLDFSCLLTLSIYNLYSQ
jgi:hypothetical protein